MHNGSVFNTTLFKQKYLFNTWPSDILEEMQNVNLDTWPLMTVYGVMKYIPELEAMALVNFDQQR